MEKEYKLTFYDNEIRIEESNVPLINSQKIEDILSHIEILYTNHIKEIKGTSFESDTEKFLNRIIESYIKKNKKVFINWKDLLDHMMEEIKFKILEKMRSIKHQHKIKHEYMHNIKLVNFFINTEKQIINITLRNKEDDRALQCVIFVKAILLNQKLLPTKISITTKVGFTIFNYTM